MLNRNYSFFILNFNQENLKETEEFPGKLMMITMKQYEDFIGFLRDDVRSIALLASEDHVAYWNQKEFPNHFFEHLHQKITAVNLCFYMPKSSSLMDEINHNILNFNAHGLMNLWKNIYRDRSFLKLKTVVEGPQKRTVDNLLGALFLVNLLRSFVLSLSCF